MTSPDDRLLRVVGIACVIVCAGAVSSARSASVQESRAPWIASAETLAVMQSGVITDRDLLERLELMPWPGKEKAARADSIKHKALSALITEKLLAAAFDRSGLTESEGIRQLRRGLENVFLRDILYKEEAVKTASVTPVDMERGRSRIREDRVVMVFQVRSEIDGTFLQERLRPMASSDSLLRRYADDLIVRSSTARIRHGSMEADIEDAAYRLRPGEVSGPVWSGTDGWLVLVLLERMTNEDAPKNLSERMRAVEKVERARAEARKAKAFYYGFLARKRADADPETFELLAAALGKHWVEYPDVYLQDSLYMFSSGLVDLLQYELREERDRVLVRTDGESLTLGEILEDLRYETFGVPELDPRTIRIELNQRVKAMVANELLAREARRRGYQRRADFVRDMRVWDDYWRGRRLYDALLDTISVDRQDMVSYLRSQNAVFGDRFAVNIREVLVPDADRVGSVLLDIAAGRMLGDIAAEGYVRPEWKSTNGISGYFPVGQHPDIGYPALLADSGEITGPVQTPAGRSIFVVLGKRSTDDRPFDAAQFRTSLHERLLLAKRRSVVSSYVRDLSKQERVRVNEAALTRLRMTTVNMFTRRYIGFGGTMTAVPMLTSQWDWLSDTAGGLEPLP